MYLGDTQTDTSGAIVDTSTGTTTYYGPPATVSKPIPWTWIIVGALIVAYLIYYGSKKR